MRNILQWFSSKSVHKKIFIVFMLSVLILTILITISYIFQYRNI